MEGCECCLALIEGWVRKDCFVAEDLEKKQFSILHSLLVWQSRDILLIAFERATVAMLAMRFLIKGTIPYDEDGS